MRLPMRHKISKFTNKSETDETVQNVHRAKKSLTKSNVSSILKRAHWKS